MQGKVCLITGATRGLGQAAALALCKQGATVVIVGRNPQRIAHTLDTIRRETPQGRAEALQADLSSRAAVRGLAGEFLSRYPRLDVLLNNVGASILEYQSSPDGTEMTWALNYLNPFLLTHLLLDRLKSTAAQHGEARIVSISSNTYRISKPDFKRLQGPQGYNGVMAYAQSKRAVAMFTRDLARRLAGSGVTANAVTPGLVATGVASDNVGWARMTMRLLNLFALPVEKGVQPIVRLAAAPELRGVTGQYFVKFQQAKPDPTCGKPEDLHNLWELSCHMAGLPDGAGAPKA